MDSRYLRLLVPAVAVVVLAFVLVFAVKALDGSGSTPTPAPAASGTPPASGPTADITRTSATPPAAATRDPRTPAGYETSCAAGFPWGRQVSKPFVCIDAPVAGTTVRLGETFVVRGYAGGGFENHVGVYWQATLVDRSVSPAQPPIFPLTYAAPDVGQPGAWSIPFSVTSIDASRLPATVQVTAFLTSPRDGSRVAEAVLQLTLTP